jgi:hypothetical protein
VKTFLKMNVSILKEMNFVSPFDKPRNKEALHWDNISSSEKRYLVEKQQELKEENRMTIDGFLKW